MKKTFNTSIDEEILEQFRAKCKEEKFQSMLYWKDSYMVISTKTLNWK